MTVKIVNVTMNTTDPHKLAEWWMRVTGGEITRDHGDFLFADAGTIGLAFQRVDVKPEPGTVLHLDLVADDLAAEVARLRGLGAELVAERNAPGIDWVTLRDPDGNEFCVSNAH